MAEVDADASSTPILGIGQYPITVMDHANGMATMAAGGLRAKAHFVQKVKDGEDRSTARRCPGRRRAADHEPAGRSTTSTSP